eukprot:scaffold79531_cov16-Prasinocladus_malaysianus.AAC.1
MTCWNSDKRKALTYWLSSSRKGNARFHARQKHSFCDYMEDVNKSFFDAGLPIWAKFRKSPALPHLIRWYEHCCTLPGLAVVIDKFDAMKKKNEEMKAKSSAKSGTGSSTPKLICLHDENSNCTLLDDRLLRDVISHAIGVNALVRRCPMWISRISACKYRFGCPSDFHEPGVPLRPVEFRKCFRI